VSFFPHCLFSGFSALQTGQKTFFDLFKGKILIEAKTARIRTETEDALGTRFCRQSSNALPACQRTLFRDRLFIHPDMHSFIQQATIVQISRF